MSLCHSFTLLGQGLALLLRRPNVLVGSNISGIQADIFEADNDSYEDEKQLTEQKALLSLLSSTTLIFTAVSCL